MPGRVTERKTRLDGTVVEFSCERLLVEPSRHAVLRYVTQQQRAIKGTDLVVPVGAVTVGHFWTDRAYNVYALTKDGRPLAYYCSIVDGTTIADDLVAYTDLVVDVLIDPKGSATVLDEDELPEDIDPRHRKTINETLEALSGNTRRLIAEIDLESAPFVSR